MLGYSEENFEHALNEGELYKVEHDDKTISQPDFGGDP